MQKSLLNIFIAFFKIGLILLGGGYVIVPIIKKELIEKRNWLNDEELCDYYCVAQCLPGIIAINTSVLVGYKLAKFKGALTAVFGISLSPIITILIVAKLIDKIMNISYIEGIFWGVNLSVIILIYLAIKDIWKNSIIDIFTTFWFILMLTLTILKINPAILIITSIVLGLIIQFIKEKKNA